MFGWRTKRKKCKHEWGEDEILTVKRYAMTQPISYQRTCGKCGRREYQDVEYKEIRGKWISWEDYKF
jgi:hypothetical protein